MAIAQPEEEQSQSQATEDTSDPGLTLHSRPPSYCTKYECRPDFVDISRVFIVQVAITSVAHYLQYQHFVKCNQT